MGSVIAVPTHASQEIKSRDEAEAALAIITAKEILINRHLFRKQRIEFLAQRRGKAIEALRVRQREQDVRLENWARGNRQEFGEAKTLDLRNGFLKLRDGQEAVVLKEKWNEQKALDAMGWTAKLILRLRALVVPKKWAECARVKIELDKTQIKKDFKAGKLETADLAAAGLEIKAEEHFSIELKISAQ